MNNKIEEMCIKALVSLSEIPPILIHKKRPVSWIHRYTSSSLVNILFAMLDHIIKGLGIAVSENLFM